MFAGFGNAVLVSHIPSPGGQESTLAVVWTALHKPSGSWFRCFCGRVTHRAHLWLLHIDFEVFSSLDCRQSKSLVETVLHQIIFAVSLNIEKK